MGMRSIEFAILTTAKIFLSACLPGRADAEFAWLFLKSLPRLGFLVP
jgi:hypothetical protein